MLRSPKERFLASTYSGQWGKVCRTEVFEEALHAALAEVQHSMPQHCDVPQQACDAHQQMIGARKLADTLYSLYAPTTTPKTTTVQTLDYKAGV